MKLPDEIEMMRLKLQMLLDLKETSDPEVIKASNELRRLLEKYYGKEYVDGTKAR